MSPRARWGIIWGTGRIPVIILIAAGALAASSGAGTTPKQTLRIVDRDPLALRGEGFKSRERVRVTLSLPVAARKMTRANALGSFQITFLQVSATRCDMVRVVAVGRAGSRALKLLPAPACMPMRSPHRQS